MTYCIFSYVCKTEMMVTNTAPPFIHFICDLLTISSNEEIFFQYFLEIRKRMSEEKILMYSRFRMDIQVFNTRL